MTQRLTEAFCLIENAATDCGRVTVSIYFKSIKFTTTIDGQTISRKYPFTNHTFYEDQCLDVVEILELFYPDVLETLSIGDLIHVRPLSKTELTDGYFIFAGEEGVVSLDDQYDERGTIPQDIVKFVTYFNKNTQKYINYTNFDKNDPFFYKYFDVLGFLKCLNPELDCESLNEMLKMFNKQHSSTCETDKFGIKIPHEPLAKQFVKILTYPDFGKLL